MNYSNVKIHNSVNIQEGAVIGVPGAIRGCTDFKGTVTIEKGCFIGSNATIAKGKNGKTVIGENTFIMNNSLVGHNVIIGKDCEIGGGVLIAGHAVIGDGVRIKTGAVIRNRIKIADGVTIGMGSVVVKDILDVGSVWYGNPATKRDNKLSTLP